MVPHRFRRRRWNVPTGWRAVQRCNLRAINALVMPSKMAHSSDSVIVATKVTASGMRSSGQIRQALANELLVAVQRIAMAARNLFGSVFSRLGSPEFMAR
jgi:hypothetical protein